MLCVLGPSLEPCCQPRQPDRALGPGKPGHSHQAGFPGGLRDDPQWPWEKVCGHRPVNWPCTACPSCCCFLRICFHFFFLDTLTHSSAPGFPQTGPKEGPMLPNLPVSENETPSSLVNIHHQGFFIWNVLNSVKPLISPSRLKLDWLARNTTIIQPSSSVLCPIWAVPLCSSSQYFIDYGVLIRACFPFPF